jgi:hypothetical protein
VPSHREEFEVEVRIRNNRLKRERVDRGWSQPVAAEHIGINLNELCGLETMRKSPLLAKGGWTTAATRIAECYRVVEDDLFPAAVLMVKKQLVVREMSAEDAGMLLESSHAERLMLGTDAPAEAAELREAIAGAIGTLTEREQKLLRLRFGLDDGQDHTYVELGEMEGVTGHRLKQIVDNALHKLRQPNRCSGLKAAVYGDESAKEKAAREKLEKEWVKEREAEKVWPTHAELRAQKEAKRWPSREERWVVERWTPGVVAGSEREG